MDETALLRAARKGDLEAFNRLVLAYQGLAYNVALRITGETRSAEDATQEAFISAFRSLRSFRGGSFRAWLLRARRRWPQPGHTQRRRLSAANSVERSNAA